MTNISSLRALAKAYGIKPSFEDNQKKTWWAPQNTLIDLINSLSGKKLLQQGDNSGDKIKNLLVERRKEKLERCLPPVCVAWDGKLKISDIWIREKNLQETLEIVLREENNDTEIIEKAIPSKYDSVRREFPGTDTFIKTSFVIKTKIPYGYFDVELRNEEKILGKSFLISSPKKLPEPKRCWGVFSPAYAIRSEKDWGMGSFKELEIVCKFAKNQGADFVGTLPLLTPDMRKNLPGPSPYSPVSKLFLDETYLDMENLPGSDGVELNEEDRKTIEKLREADLVDHGKTHAIKKKYLLKISEDFFAGDAHRNTKYQTFIKKHPDTREYAEFRSQKCKNEEEKARSINYHLYAQYASHRQLMSLKEKAAAGEIANLYLDYPVGVCNYGFETQKMPHLFVKKFDTGAPPDKLSSTGQNWSFMPVNPVSMIEDRFSYFRKTLQNYFSYASIVRLDHIMGFYRIFCIPENEHPAKGAYIKYPFEAIMAVLCFEASRYNCLIIGEDMGVVPREVRSAMDEHEMLRMWLFQFYLKSTPKRTVESIPENCIASVNTHDMPTFNSFFNEEDIESFVKTGLFNKTQAEEIRKDRKNLLKGWKVKEKPFIFVLQNLASSSARFLQVTLEDLWGETLPQNMPGTVEQYPNWRKKFRHTIEAWTKDKDVIDILGTVNKHRNKKEVR